MCNLREKYVLKCKLCFYNQNVLSITDCVSYFMVSKAINGLVYCIAILVRYRSGAKSVQDSDRFRLIRHSSIFIDKTLLLKQIVKHDFLHITVPSKFGKTTNLLMIKLFFGNNHQKRFVADYFRATKIWEERSFVIKHMCNYPIIHFNFATNESVRNHRDIVEKFKMSIQNSFLEHEYLLNSSLVSNDSKAQYRMYCNLEEREFETGLHFLSKLLHAHYKKRVTILLDNFDNYLIKTIFEEDIDPRVVSGILFRILDNTINLNDFVERSILFSSTSCKLGTQFSGTDRFRTLKFMESQEFVPFFGFTKNETYELLRRFNLGEKSANVTEWYGGYTPLHSDCDCQVFNPWSVLSYIRHHAFNVYWMTKPMMKLLCRYLKPHYLMRDNVIPKLLKYENVAIKRTGTLTSYEFETLKELNTESNTVPDEITDYHLLLQLFLECGYLTFGQKYIKIPIQTKVKLPNKEVRRAFQLILEHLTATYYDSFTD